MTDEPIKLDACPACGYDMTGSPSSVCPECGADTDRGADIVRRNFLRRSIKWIIAGGLIIAASILYRALYFAGEGFSPLEPVAVLVFIIGIVTAIGLPLALRGPEPFWRLTRRIWLRASFWLYLPWFVVPALAFIAQGWHSLATRGMAPGPAIADHWHTVSTLPCAGFVIAPIIAFSLWLWRWQTLHRRAMIPECGLIAPIVVAIISEVLITGVLIFDLAVLFVV